MNATLMRPVVPVLLAFCFTGCRGAAQPVTVDQVIRVDAAHSHLVAEGSALPPIYRLRPAPGFMLDASGFTFAIPEQLASAGVTGPNSIQIIRDKRHFASAWKSGTSSYRIAADSMQSTRGNGDFPDLIPGESFVVAVGYLDSSAGTGWKGFSPFWACVVDVE
ncbi:MAG: hypothetical protein L0Y66_03430 [Myxococcaceae bacterium]|nr:hypothetical protein [Myxococcaceae bacterium]MCI0670556.1 hypothetical protein [Myxococcaceae bacterium]